MTQDLQQLLERINAEGVAKANAEAERIIGAANARAKGIVEAASREAEQAVAKARAEADAFSRQAEATVRQAMRDTLLDIEKKVEALLTKLLVQEASAAMSNPSLVATLAAEAVRAYLPGHGGAMDVLAAPELADALRAKLAQEARGGGVTVVTDERTGSGFKVRLAGGRVEHDFTGAAVADALARGLRPRLAELLK
ncbi:MAG: hypothetical protein FWG50_11930 [Kiritimatiellaeota bacterium]|nr:hypothetical protein [Kiritimatiellota bacterium]